MKKEKYKLPQVRIKMVRDGRSIYSFEPISCPESCYEAIRKFLKDEDREYFLVIPVDKKLRPINFSVASIGGVDCAFVDAKNVFKTVLLSNATGFFVAHNHPSGGIIPSGEDIALTRKLIEGAKCLDLDFYDHIICGESRFLSIRQEKLVDEW